MVNNMMCIDGYVESQWNIDQKTKFPKIEGLPPSHPHSGHPFGMFWIFLMSKTEKKKSNDRQSFVCSTRQTINSAIYEK